MHLPWDLWTVSNKCAIPLELNPLKLPDCCCFHPGTTQRPLHRRISWQLAHLPFRFPGFECQNGKGASVEPLGFVSRIPSKKLRFKIKIKYPKWTKCWMLKYPGTVGGRFLRYWKLYFLLTKNTEKNTNETPVSSQCKLF